jgi:hypothetical protein
MTGGRLKESVLCAMGICDLPYIFRELRPAVSGETGKATVVDGGFFAALLTPGS